MLVCRRCLCEDVEVVMCCCIVLGCGLFLKVRDGRGEDYGKTVWKGF